MTWPHATACFFSGMVLTNVVPHFVHGISGDRFPTPFSRPPGQGLSSPMINMIWALFNLVIGFILFRVGNVKNGTPITLGVFFAGIATISILSSIRFAEKDVR